MSLGREDSKVTSTSTYRTLVLYTFQARFRSRRHGSGMNRHASFFAACAEVAKESNMAFRLGAVVVKNRKIVGKGKNSSLR